MPLTEDLHPSPEEERKHERKCLVQQSLNSYFRDVNSKGFIALAIKPTLSLAMHK